MCSGFEKAVNSPQAKELNDIYITGSNAFPQSSDLATLFVGRTIEISLFLFSFAEFMKYYSYLNQNEGLNNYILSVEEKTDHKTIDKYIGYPCSSFLFYKINRYDIKGRKYLKTGAKYYLCDHSSQYARLKKRNMDYGRILENIVAVELFRRGCEVYAGKLYIQIANSIADPDTFSREITPLLQIRDAYPKMIITRIYQPAYQYESVQIIDAADWLRIKDSAVVF